MSPKRVHYDRRSRLLGTVVSRLAPTVALATLATLAIVVTLGLAGCKGGKNSPPPLAPEKAAPPATTASSSEDEESLAGASVAPSPDFSFLKPEERERFERMRERAMSGGNIPHPLKAGEKEYLAATDEEIRKLIKDFNPDLEASPEASTGVLLASQELTRIGPKAIPFLMEAVDSEYPNVRVGALFTLGHMLHQPAIPKFIEKLLYDPDHIVRICAARGLPIFKSKEGEAALLKCAFDPEPEVRSNVLNSLGLQEDPEGIPVLGQIAGDLNEGEWVRRTAIFSLGYIKDPAAIKHLSPLANDEVEEIRVQVSRAMAEIGGHDAGPPLIQALDDKSSRVRREAALGLGKVGGEAAITALVLLLERERDKGVLQTTVYTLSLIGDRQHIRFIEPFIVTDNVRLEDQAFRAIYYLRGEPPLADIQELLDDDGFHTRMFAVWALGVYGADDSKGFESILPLIEDENDRVRDQVVLALGRYRDRSLVPALAALIPKETAPDVLMNAVFFSNLYLARDTLYDRGKEAPRSREAMRMIYLPEDRLLVPEYIQLMTHEYVFVRREVGMALKAASGLDFGYDWAADESNWKEARIKASAWWDERKDISPDEWMRKSAEQAIEKLASDDPIERHLYAEALEGLTGNSNPLTVEATPDEVRQAIEKWKSWWAENGSKTRIEWLMEGISDPARHVEDRMTIFSEIFTFYTDERFGITPGSPAGAKRAAMERLLEWWKENRQRLVGGSMEDRKQ
ncbi:MAG: HEAT repeat domain-containing protein [Planctomycetota bacterium]|nr:HEAT repeat domain-containing protein [Planctomycetota bacterium]